MINQDVCSLSTGLGHTNLCHTLRHKLVVVPYRPNICEEIALKKAVEFDLYERNTLLPESLQQTS